MQKVKPEYRYEMVYDGKLIAIEIGEKMSNHFKRMSHRKGINIDITPVKDRTDESYS
jgi:hypothetical protein